MKDENKKEIVKDPITIKLLIDLLINVKKNEGKNSLI
jgi:hypothetical protein